MKYLLIGLGNIGAEYATTRHNIGFMVLDQLAQQHDVSFEEKRLAAVAHFRYRGQALYLVKPNTYMNNSGKAVRYWLQHLQVPVARSLVITDDIMLPFGKLRMRAQGSAAGHNGLKSIEEHTNTQAYPRLKVGVGSDFPKGRQADYVLANFTAAEQEDLPAIVAKAGEAAAQFCKQGIALAMAQCNGG